jgi:glucokinase
MDKILIGVDVGGTSVKTGMFSREGRLIAKTEIPTDREDNCKNVIRDIAQNIHAMAEKYDIREENVIGTGIGVPGPVLKDGYVEVCVNLGWRDKYPGKELAGFFPGMRVELGNDANVAAFGEAWQGGAKGYANVVLLTLGTGVGGGVILDNHILNGRHGLAGELGHIHIRDEEKEFCNCGGQGCLEQVSSATGIVREAKRMLLKNTAPSAMRDFGDRLTAKDVCDCGKAGDRTADETMETVCRYLGLAISYATMTVDPDVFVIGGGVSAAGEYLIGKIMKYYDRYTTISKNHAKIVTAKLGNDAGIYGAARMVLE